MTIRVAEVGKAFRYGTGFDMSSSTALSLKFTKPDLTTATVTDPRVTAPGLTITDPDVGELLTDTYMEFTTLATDFDQAGTWTVCGIYTDAVPQVLIGAPATFVVEAGC